MKRYCGIGGQAVLEGIMMKNQDKYAVAVRKPNQEIEVKVDKYKSFCEGKKILSLPFVRGIFNFVDSMVLGIKTLMYSSEFYEEFSGNPFQYGIVCSRGCCQDCHFYSVHCADIVNERY